MRELDYGNKGNLESSLNLMEALMDVFFDLSIYFKDIDEYFNRLEESDIPSEEMVETLQRYKDIEEMLSDLSGNYFEFKSLTDLFNKTELLFRVDLNNILQKGRASYVKGSYLNPSTFL